MERYNNLGGDSGVAAFETTADSITIQFSTGATYLYNYQSAGSHHIEQMKVLAHAGEGLNSYTKRYVNRGYAAKLR